MMLQLISAIRGLVRGCFLIATIILAIFACYNGKNNDSDRIDDPFKGNSGPYSEEEYNPVCLQ